MTRFLLLPALALAACQPTTTATGPVASLPGASAVCSLAADPSAFDTALKAYDAATDAVGLLIDVKVIKPGSSTALALAAANDKVLAGFAAAEHARQVCNAADYISALTAARAAIADIRAALPKKGG